MWERLHGLISREDLYGRLEILLLLLKKFLKNYLALKIFLYSEKCTGLFMLFESIVVDVGWER